MSTSPNLPSGAFITSLGGRRCTALPRTDVNTQTSSSTASTSISVLSSPSPLPSSLSSSSSSSSSQSLPPPASFSSLSSTPPVAASVSQPPLAQATAAAAATPPPAVTTSTPEAQFSIVASNPVAVSSSTVAIPQTQASVADTSNAASSTVDVAPTSTASSAPPPQSEVLQTDASSTSAAAFTTIGINNPSSTSSSTINNQAAGATTTLVAVSGSNTSINNSNSTVAVAGGVIGGVAALGLIAFFIWFWRRRILKRRRSTLLTPLSVEPSFGGLGGEKRPYPNARGSIGPTPQFTRVKAALRSQYGRVRGRFDTIKRSGSMRRSGSLSSGRSVDMDRGNSQFMDTSPMVNGRKGSNASAIPPRGGSSDMSIKERVLDIWGRFRGQQPDTPTFEDNNKNDIFAARGIGGSTKSNNTSKTRPLTNKPDFLTLLNMDDGELDREAQRRRVSRTRDGGGGSLGSSLGDLNLDFGNPFSDANAIPRKPGPLVVSASDNPFADDNAIAGPAVSKPSTYINDIRRSRGMSYGTASVDLSKSYDLHGLRVVNEASRPPSGVAGAADPSAYYRDSAASLESFATKRNKFRSDPFDLEPLSYVSDNPLGRPDVPDVSGRYSNTGSISIAYQGTVGKSNNPGVPNVPKIPAAAHTRNVSDLSSRYTSGISEDSLGDWSDPGPDVGPGAQSKWDTSRNGSTAAGMYSPVAGSGPYDTNSRRNSRSSDKSSLKMGYAL